MDIPTLTSFFMWCTLINGSLLALWIVFSAFAPGLVYRTQRIFFPLPRETFDVVIYSFLGLFKIIFLVLNVTPYVALLILGSN